MWLLHSINQHLEAASISASRFGREALGDPRFVRDLRRGRVPRPETEAKVRAYLAAASAAGR